jgi:predicted RNase H-like HicB family nuclease
MTDPHYHINVFWSDEDDCWIADVPDLRYCSAHGDTPSEAVDEVRAAMQGWLEVARDKGMVIPEPSYRPAADPEREAA